MATGVCFGIQCTLTVCWSPLAACSASALLPLGGFGLLFISTNSTDPSLLWPPSSPSERCSPSLLCACTRNAPCTHDQRFQQPLQPTNSHVICRESFIHRRDHLAALLCLCARTISHLNQSANALESTEKEGRSTEAGEGIDLAASWKNLIACCSTFPSSSIITRCRPPTVMQR